MKGNKSNIPKQPISFDTESDKTLIEMVLAGKLSRNKHFNFFKTERGQEIFKRTKRLQGFIKDMNNGCEIVEKNIVDGLVRLTIENKMEKYKRTVVMDSVLFDILDEKF